MFREKATFTAGQTARLAGVELARQQRRALTVGDLQVLRFGLLTPAVTCGERLNSFDPSNAATVAERQ